MTLVLHAHPPSLLCQKVLMAFYESDVRFALNLVDPSASAARESFASVWPMVELPVLEDRSRREIVAEATAIIEYVDLFYPEETRLLPFNPVVAWKVRLRDRFFDHHVRVPLQRIVTDRQSILGRSDPHGAPNARAHLRASLDILERDMAGRTWALSEGFSMADCSAAPALWHTNTVIRLEQRHPNVAAYLHRLQKRSSFERVLKEAIPFQEVLAG